MCLGLWLLQLRGSLSSTSAPGCYALDGMELDPTGQVHIPTTPTEYHYMDSTYLHKWLSETCSRVSFPTGLNSFPKAFLGSGGDGGLQRSHGAGTGVPAALTRWLLVFPGKFVLDQGVLTLQGHSYIWTKHYPSTRFLFATLSFQRQQRKQDRFAQITRELLLTTGPM